MLLVLVLNALTYTPYVSRCLISKAKARAIKSGFAHAPFTLESLEAYINMRYGRCVEWRNAEKHKGAVNFTRWFLKSKRFLLNL